MLTHSHSEKLRRFYDFDCFLWMMAPFLFSVQFSLSGCTSRAVISFGFLALDDFDVFLLLSCID